MPNLLPKPPWYENDARVEAVVSNLLTKWGRSLPNAAVVITEDEHIAVTAMWRRWFAELHGESVRYGDRVVAEAAEAWRAARRQIPDSPSPVTLMQGAEQALLAALALKDHP